MRKFYLTLLFSGLFILFAQSQEVVPGVIEIQLQPEAEQQIQQYRQAQRLNVAPGRLNVGIRRFDELNTRFGAVSMERIFPDAGEHEEKHRRAGLHLWYKLHLDTLSDVRQAAKAYGELSELGAVSVVYPIKRIQAVPPVASNAAGTPQDNIGRTAASNDPRYVEQWHYHNDGSHGRGVAGVDIRLPEAWDITAGTSNVIVAVVDGGIDYNHPDIAPNMWSGIGRNFVTNSNVVTPDDHGTHVAGTIAAVSNNGIGVAGIAGGTGSGNGVRLMSCQIFDGNRSTSGANAITYAADNGAVICQNSWGYENEGVYNKSDSAAIRYFIANARSSKMNGGIVIFAAGNDNKNGAHYPGYFDFVVSVASVTSKGTKAYYSNYGSWVSIAAPGGDYYNTGTAGGATADASRTILSTAPNNNYGWMQGTSMACPHVSGVAALIVSRYGNASYPPDSVRLRLLGSARSLATYDAGYAPMMGAGLLDAQGALAPFSYITNITISGCPGQPVYTGSTVNLSATFVPETAFDKRLVWSSGNRNIATVTDGVVHAVGLGTVTISVSAQSGGARATCTLDVRQISVERVEFVYDYYELMPGESATLRANVIPNNATDKTITFESKHPAIAEVNGGTVTARGIGSTFITVTSRDGEHRDTCYIDVVKPVTGVGINPPYIRIKTGNTMALEAVIEPPDAGNKRVIWQSNNTSVVDIDNTTGVITARNGGSETDPKSAMITVTTENGAFTATAQVSVYEAEHVPQGFSPNSDGVNDYFVLTLDSQENYALKVFDRSGQVYFQADPYDNKWNGTANTGVHSGKTVLPGTYYYSLVGKNSGRVKTGYFIIKN